MPSIWTVRRATKRATRFQVMYRPGGREVNPRYGGTLGTMREAPNPARLDRRRARRAAYAPACHARRAAGRADARRGGRTLAGEPRRRLGKHPPDAPLAVRAHAAAARLTAGRFDHPTDVQELIGTLAAKGSQARDDPEDRARARMVLDFAGVQPNPARDRVHVKLPRAERRQPPRRGSRRSPYRAGDAGVGELNGSPGATCDEPARPLAHLGRREQDRPRSLGAGAARPLRAVARCAARGSRA